MPPPVDMMVDNTCSDFRQPMTKNGRAGEEERKKEWRGDGIVRQRVKEGGRGCTHSKRDAKTIVNRGLYTTGWNNPELSSPTIYNITK